MAKKEIGRDQWTFTFTVSDLLANANAACSYHIKREQHWIGEWDKARENVPEGLRVDLLQVTGGTRADVKLDPAVLERLSLAQSKKEGHQAKRKEYEKWILALSRESKERLLTLRFSDVLFFYPPIEEEIS